DYTPLRHVSEESLETEAQLFPVRTAKWYIERRPLGGGRKASQGEAYFTAPNPPFGATFTYHLADGYKTRKQKRQKEEQEIAREGGDTPTPGWDALIEEDLEPKPEIVLTVRDADGAVVRRLTGPAKAGFHRVAWDLRYPSMRPWTPPRADRPEFDRRERGGPLAPPGTYSVEIAKRVDGKLV
ncbi:MAG: glycosyl hydrolase, partial [Acidobacteria bacterium]|nr:glycosyl hydrolase [Acidobacteriota bacterium]NIM63437.1 glycosyl hydrolase [Acidobacteriota bacterium]NIO59156.1 glycosyl hydrolase [Acidobacteriota bacterium]NIQ30187.1 glycosyl hydrolase [Acidobacteriota bacterium]NIQ85064.1 glycosyl hydrolase [Acidobacteriota bacterium]